MTDIGSLNKAKNSSRRKEKGFRSSWDRIRLAYFCRLATVLSIMKNIWSSFTVVETDKRPNHAGRGNRRVSPVIRLETLHSKLTDVFIAREANRRPEHADRGDRKEV